MKLNKISMVAAAIAAAFASQAHADTYDWGQLGSSFTTIASPATVISGLGATATVSDGGTLERRDEGNGWEGIFAPGAQLLWNEGGVGDIVVTFANPVASAGAQIQGDVFTTFTGSLSAFDSLGNLLGTTTVNGNNNGAEDNSAPFLGITTGIDDIKSIDFSLPVGGNNDFALGTLNASTVPDAGTTLGLFGMALIGLGAIRRKI